jgi:hypothetical protein
MRADGATEALVEIKGPPETVAAVARWVGYGLDVVEASRDYRRDRGGVWRYLVVSAQGEDDLGALVRCLGRLLSLTRPAAGLDQVEAARLRARATAAAGRLLELSGGLETLPPPRPAATSGGPGNWGEIEDA